MRNLSQLLQSQVNILDEEWEYFSSFLQPKNFPKNTTILTEHEVESYLYFVESGITRYYVITPEGKEVCLLFTFDNGFMSEMSSFISREPSGCFIETLSETKTWRIHYNDVQKLYTNTKVGNHFGRIALEQLYIRKAKREKSFLIQTPEQRYLDLLHFAQHILHQIPLKHIASYLGVTPQALSRIRKRIN